MSFLALSICLDAPFTCLIFNMALIIGTDIFEVEVELLFGV